MTSQQIKPVGQSSYIIASNLGWYDPIRSILLLLMIISCAKEVRQGALVAMVTSACFAPHNGIRLTIPSLVRRPRLKMPLDYLSDYLYIYARSAWSGQCETNCSCFTGNYNITDGLPACHTNRHT